MPVNTARTPRKKQWSDRTPLTRIPNPAAYVYRIRIENPEVTFLGMQRQPDFGKVVIEYVPRTDVMELKSLKLYFFQFRNMRISYERLVTTVFNDLVTVYRPRHLRVIATFNPRGGIMSTVCVDSDDTRRGNARAFTRT